MDRITSDSRLEAPPPQATVSVPMGKTVPDQDDQETSPLLHVAVKHMDDYFGLAFGKARPENNALQTIMLLVNTSIGSGILNQPYVFKQAGIGAACLLYPLGGLVTWAGLYMLVEAAQVTGARDYGGLAEAVFGPWGSFAVDLSLLLLCYGCLCSYLVAIGGLASALLHAWTSVDSALTSESFLSLMAAALLLPICLARHYGSMVHTAGYSLVAVSLVMVLVVAYGPIQGSANSGEALTWFSSVGSLRGLGSIIFSLSCAHATFHAAGSMKDRSLRTWNIVTLSSTAISTVMCLVTGLVGYLSFRSDTQGEILDNFTAEMIGKRVGAQAFKVLLVVHLLLCIAPDFIIMRYSTLMLCGLNAETVSTPLHVGSTAALLCSIVLLVLMLYLLDLSEGEAFDYVITLSGAWGAAFSSFAMPGAIAWKLHGADTWLGGAGAVLCAFGLAMAIVVPVALFV